MLKTIATFAAIAVAAPAFAQITPGGGGEPPICFEGVCPGPYNGPPVAAPQRTEATYFRAYYQSGGSEAIDFANNFSQNFVPIVGLDLAAGDATSGYKVKVVPDMTGTTASAFAEAQADWATPAKVYSGYSLLFKITAEDMAAADALSALVDYNPRQATAKGKYTLAATGSGVAEVGIYQNYLNVPLTGVNFFTAFRCDPTEYVYSGPITSGCGSHDYSQSLGIVRGSHLFFNNDPAQVGSALDFYGEITIVASVQAGDNNGAYNTTPAPGFASAFIDPVFALPSSLNNYQFYVNGPGGQQQLLGFVPEPAAWAMLIGGFGLVGGAARRQRIPATA